MSNGTNATGDFGTDFLNCAEGGIETNYSCYNTKISATQIVSGLVINLCIGALCYTGFVLWRDKFRIYFNRMHLPEVPAAKRPPAMEMRGLRRLWSWLVPVFTVSDGDLLESAGLDALMAQRVIGFGCLALVPLTILGIGVLLPVNYTSYEAPPGTDTTNSTASVDDEFLKMTMSGIPSGSPVLWVHFSFTYIFMGWVCFLLIQYYKEFISLRQAHDEKLVRSAELGRRTSLLDDQLPAARAGSVQQIMSQLRMRLSLASGSWAGGSVLSGGLGAGDMAGKHIAVRFSYGLASELGSGEEVLGSAAGSSSLTSRQAGGGGAAVGSSSSGSGSMNLNPDSTLRMRGRGSSTHQEGQAKGGGGAGGRGSNGAAQREQQQKQAVPERQHSSSSMQEPAGAGGLASQASIPGGHDDDEALVAHRGRHLSGISEGEENGARDGSDGGVEAVAGPTPAGFGAPLSITEGPFHGASTAVSGELAGLGSGSSKAGIAGIAGSVDSDDGGHPKWDELTQPFSLLQSADAAQFYTVLVVDEALEEFSYRHTEAPWIWKLPQKLASTPKSSLKALDNFFSESKPLARVDSQKQKEHLHQCERRMLVAEQTYREIFGADFDRIVPVYNPKPADALLLKWHRKRLLLERLRLQHMQLGEQQQRVLQEGQEEQLQSAEVLQLRQDVERLQQDVDRQLQQRQKQKKGGKGQVQQEEEEQQQQPDADIEAAAVAASGRDAMDSSGGGEPQVAVRRRWCFCGGQLPEEPPQPEQQLSLRQSQQQLSQRQLQQQTEQQLSLRQLQQQLSQRQSVQQQPGADLEVGTSAAGSGGADSGDTGSSSSEARRRWCPCCGPLTEEQRKKKSAKLAALLEQKAAEILKAERSLADLQGRLEEAQFQAAESLPAPCFFATFRSAQAAAYAARLNLNPLHERMMRAVPAPAPNNVNYTALLRGWLARGTRPLVVFIFVLLMLLFPIGTFTGMCGTIVSSVCGGTPGTDSSTLSAERTWFCSDDWFAGFLRTLITSILPSILLSVWQAIVLPLWFYTCAQAEGGHYSFTALDLRCATWFFLHDVFNVFLGGMLGGSIVWGLRAVINEPSKFFTILGAAVPASSNFFINYVSFKGIAMAPFRLFFPHAIVFGSILKWLRLVPSPKTELDKRAAAPPISLRYSRDLGVLQLTVFVVTLGYAVVTPIILPFGLVYFLLTWPVWRYQVLYVYQGHYSCGGQFWVYCAHRIVVCLGVMATFTAAMIAVKGGYVSALILFFTSVSYLWWFDRYLAFRYDAVVDQLPAVGILKAPPARVDDSLYVPPPMRHRGMGWNPEWGKAWYGYGMPRYGL